jgi:hypothetical protein
MNIQTCRVMKIPLMVVLTMVIIILPTTPSWGQTSATYSLRTSVLDESAGAANSANNKLEVSSVGQPTPIGESQSANYKAYAGYLYTLEVTCSPAPVIVTAALPNGNQGCPYSEVLEVQAGTGTSPLHWTIIAGTLASGLSLNETTGELEGSPADTGIFDFTVQVEDLCSEVDTRSLSLRVDPYADVKGDPTGDCAINVLDVLMVANIILENIAPTEKQAWRADCNSPPGNCDGDMTINVLDAVKIVNIILGLDSCP